ncbi:hypothetical protein Pcaca03_32450 [Pectobacterium carotovorum subsp. carotovorum]|uniref:Uncharacterized protein n=1 Tax=Pectobacterium carotovorum subsp. carotovorum TaxID=555 RepID=A0AAI9L240_PECCC|nr:hypothetical protein SOASR016_31090 [Pectobacterium carotovorum subsp. carotovorum]GLV70801.1 hypothetical protein Pcaca03_32450 [Pectobacterium carotovorum subsp. carotovorum]
MDNRSLKTTLITAYFDNKEGYEYEDVMSGGGVERVTSSRRAVSGQCGKFGIDGV